MSETTLEPSVLKTRGLRSAPKILSFLSDVGLDGGCSPDRGERELGLRSLRNADPDLLSDPKLPGVPDPVDLFQGLHRGVVVLSN